MHEKIAKIISFIFNPVILPTLGFILLLHSGFYSVMLNSDAKRFLLLIVFFNTATLPLLSIALLAVNSKFNYAMKNARDRVFPLLSASVFYYLGFILLNRMRFYPIFKLFMIASVLLIVLLLLISFKWKISIHMAAIGAITSTLIALSFRTGLNPVGSIVLVIFVSGLIGTARLALNKNNLTQIVAGYVLGFVVLYPVIYFL